MNPPDEITRRRALTATGATLTAVLAGCGNPEGQEGEDDSSPRDGDGDDPDEDAPTATAENDPYAPEEDSERGSGNRTIDTRGTDQEGDDGESEGESGDDDASQGNETEE